MLRVLCVDDKLKDGLNLRDPLRGELRSVNDVSARGTGAGTINYLDATDDDLPGALSPRLQYKVTGNTVTVHLLLTSGDTTVAESNMTTATGKHAGAGKDAGSQDCRNGCGREPVGGVMVRWIGVAALCLLGGSAGVGAAAQTTSPPALLIPCSRPVSVSEGRVKVLATNAASSWFATLGEDEMLCFWNAADAQFLAQLPANGVEAVAVLPKSHLAVLAYDRFGEPSSELRLVDVDTFTTVKTLRVDDSMRWLQSTADGRLFAVGFHGLYRIDPATLAPTRLAGLGEGTFSQAVLNEEGSLLAVTSQEVGKADVHVQVFATSDGSRRFARDVRGSKRAVAERAISWRWFRRTSAGLPIRIPATCWCWMWELGRL